MIKYHQESINVETLKKNTIDRLLTQIIPAKKWTLEVDCATGSLSEYFIKNMGCTVLGIEPSPEQTRIKSPRTL